MNDATEDKNWDPLGRIWNDQPDSDGEVFTEWYGTLTKAEQILFPTYWLCVEVYNGGFHQYFTNSTGHHAPEAILGFCELGLNDIAEIVQQAIAIFGETFPRKRADREEFLASFEGDDISEWNPFFNLDDDFYEAIKVREVPELYNDDRLTIVAKKYLGEA